MPNIDYIGVDLHERAHIVTRMDLAETPIASDSIDAAICVHVLEEIPKDRQAIGELFRVLRPGGWALISVPIRLNEKTFEDPSITSPQDRKRAFGEEAHVRIYGSDLVQRLREPGFEVQLDLATDIPQQSMDQYGLLNDENIFFCTKP
jgi:SAM-dependent methyltransferase